MKDAILLIHCSNARLFGPLSLRIGLATEASLFLLFNCCNGPANAIHCRLFLIFHLSLLGQIRRTLQRDMIFLSYSINSASFCPLVFDSFLLPVHFFILASLHAALTKIYRLENSPAVYASLLILSVDLRGQSHFTESP